MNFGKINHIILFGGGGLLAEFALKLSKDNFKVLIVTSERHSKETIRANSGILSLKEFFEENRIDYHLSQNINTDNYVIGKITDNTLGISMGADCVFNASFIGRFNGKLVNVHGTRLPQNRGGGMFSWQILRSNRLGFSLIHQVDLGIDTGPIIKYKEFFYAPSCRIPKDYQQLYEQSTLVLLNEFLENIKDEKEFECIPQQEYFSIYWPRLATEIHGFIDWNWSLRDIELLICAFDEPYKGASTFINNKRLFLKKCFSDFNDGGFHPFQTGIVYRKTKSALYIAAKEGALIVEEVTDENGRDVIAEIKIGDRFYTPVSFLEKAKQYRAFYTCKGLKKSTSKKRT